MNAIKYFIGPMSKNIVDTIIDFSNKNNVIIGLIPSRRQIEFDGGYVNNWTTQEFSKYASSLLLKRDHSGPDQGQTEDDGYESLKHDCQYLDMIHIDPWKKYPSFKEGLQETINMINYCYSINPDIEYEVGTEEVIRYFEPFELDNLINELQSQLKTEVFSRITYLVIQSGTSLKGNTQTGSYNPERLKEMIKVCKKYNLFSKEHNGDYISISTIKEKFNLGLDSINIAPEFGLIETQTYLDEIKDNSLLEKFFNICFESGKWKKWVDEDFDPYNQKLDLIKICGHYVLSSPRFLLEIKSQFPEIDKQIKTNIKTKLEQLYGFTA
jgi:fructose/tagatose bisphosphate aldolase